jgi:hypothetical protein
LDSTAASDSTKYGMTASFKPATLILPTHTTQRYVQRNKWEECGPSKIGMDATLTSHYPAGRCGGPWPWPGIGPLWHTQQAERHNTNHSDARMGHDKERRLATNCTTWTMDVPVRPV